jgi:osmoprotectant transport system permease protein
VSLATLAFFAGAGGLGGQIYADPNFKSNVVVAGGLCVLLALVIDVLLRGLERVLTPWARGTAA